MKQPSGVIGYGNRCFGGTRRQSLFRGVRRLITLQRASRS